MRLTILFDNPYWIALLEDERDGLLYAARHIFGPEPNDAQVYEFVRHEAGCLLASMTVGVPVDAAETRQVGYKRMIRETKRAMQVRSISTAAQDALRQQIEQNKQERHATSRAERDAEREHKREVALQKAREKHRGH
jgi:hypothetical protein